MMNNEDIGLFVEDCGQGNLKGVLKFIKTHYVEPNSIKNLIISTFSNKQPIETVDMIDRNHQLNAINFGFESACLNNQLEVLKILFSNKYTKNRIRLDFNNSNYLSEICSQNYHETLKFLLRDKSVSRKISVNNHSVFSSDDSHVNTSNISVFGNATPLMRACENSSNEVIEILLDFKNNNQVVQSPLLIKGLICCLQKSNLTGAKMIIESSDLLEKINNHGKLNNYFSTVLAIELGGALLNDNKDIIDFISNDCELDYSNQLQDIDPYLHGLINTYMFKEKLDCELPTRDVQNKKSRKI